MAEIKTITILTLSDAEAKWLRAWLQNPFPGETPEDTEFRAKFFAALTPSKVPT